MTMGVGLLLYRCLVEKQASGPLPVGFSPELTLSHHLPSNPSKEKPASGSQQVIRSSRLHHWLPQSQVPS